MRMRSSLYCAMMLAALAGVLGIAHAGENQAVLLERELAAKAEEAVKARTVGALCQDVGLRLKAVLNEPGAVSGRGGELEVLEHYFNVGRLLNYRYDDETGKFLIWLLGQRALCSRLLHALEPTDSPAGAIDVLRRLKSVKGVDEKLFLRYGEMAVAMALVWDTYQWLRWTNVQVPEGRLEEIYEHYLKNGGGMQFPPDALPHELMVFVIDHPLTREEREYALNNFRGCANFGKLFFDIKWTKDPSSLCQGKNKQVPYTLMNIKKLNGVCMEQAYYASCIAKCAGVPATYCQGFGARGGHAWVGVLVNRGGAFGWDFNSGRYSYDHYWKGAVFDPTFRRAMLSDGEVAMTAGLARLPKTTLESADARRTLALFVLSGWAAQFPPAPVQKGTRPAPPELSAEHRALAYELLMASAKANPFSRRTWQTVGTAAARGVFSLKEIQAFSDLLFLNVDQYSPDFACATAQKFLAAVKEDAERNRLYETFFAYFRKRPDLAAEIKVAQGRMWETQGKADQALKAYLEAVATFPRDGHVTQQAAASIDAVLSKGEPRKAVETLTAVWRSMEAAQQGRAPEEREAMRIMGENLIKYMKLAGMKQELAAFEPAFRRMFPAGKQ